MEIEIPITPMLDMAFQLLTFFILTYRPAPAEVQFSMNLLPAQPATEMKREISTEPASGDVPAELRTLKTVLRAGPDGLLSSITLADMPVDGLAALKTQLESFVNDKDASFDQALLKIDAQLKSSEVVKVIDTFSSLKPKPLTKLSLGLIDDNGAEGTPP
jgi:biopolymer transport protein ExbD